MSDARQRNVHIDDATWTRAQARARGEGLSMSALVRHWLTLYANGETPTWRAP